MGDSEMNPPVVDAGLDHRIVMATLVAGLPLSGETEVVDADAASSLRFPTSWTSWTNSVHRSITIAIDGPASSGKGTVARTVARRLNYAYIDTGAMYRSVALAAQRRGLDLAHADELVELTTTLEFQFRWSAADFESS